MEANPPNPPRLRAPRADLKGLSVCPAEPAALADWVSTLPMGNTSETAAQLLSVTPEIGRVRADHQTKLDLLEAIRPTLHYVCARLDRNVLSQDANWNDMADTAQALQTSLCDGYCAVVSAAQNLLAEDRGSRESFVAGLHRALSDYSRTLLRSLRLYTEPDDSTWMAMNQLYAIATAYDIAEQKHDDAQNHSSHQISVEDAYLRAILLQVCRPNQLRARELNQVFNALELWSPWVKIGRSKQGALFAVDLDEDESPVYVRDLQDAGESIRYIDTKVLAYELEAYRKEIESSVPVPEQTSTELIDHLVTAWSVAHRRAHRRLATKDEVKLCVGLRSTHFNLSGRVEFEQQIAAGVDSKHLNPFAAKFVDAPTPAKSGDVWDDAVRARMPQIPQYADAERSVLARNDANKWRRSTKSYDPHLSRSTNTSATGFCLRWPDSAPANLQVGELLALQDNPEAGWCIGTLRWISKERSGGSIMGLELLSPHAEPVAARVVRTKGGTSDFVRALLVPENRRLNQPSMLITPRLPFAPNQKVHVQRAGKQTTVQLQSCVRSTESFNQFTFRMLGSYLENQAARRNISR